MERLRKPLLVAVVLMLAAAAFVGGWSIQRAIADQEYNKLLSQTANVRESLRVEKNKVGKLDKLYNAATDEAADLRGQIASMRDKPAEIRYIVRTETIIEGRTEFVEVLPEAYIHRLENGMPVAAFSVKSEDGYEFETYDLAFRGSVVVGEKDTSVLLIAESSAEPDKEYELEVDALVSYKARETPVFMPNVHLGASAGMLFAPIGSETPIGAFLGASIGVSFIHPNEDIDVLTIKGIFNDKGARVGFDPISFRLKRIPIFTDIWVAPGVSIGSQSPYPSIDLTISSKF